MIKQFLLDRTEKNHMKKSLYQLIQKEGSISKIDLLKVFHVPKTTINRLMDELENKGFIRVAGFGKPSGGRPPVLYEAVASAGCLVGIEIARTHVNIMLVNMKFQNIGQVSFSLTGKHTPKYTISLIINGIKNLLMEFDIKEETMIGIGIGAVGPIDYEEGVILNPEAFPADGWENVPIVSLLKKKFFVPIRLNNGANTAALAEYHFQPISDKNILYCINGYGIRCGFIHEGKLLNSRQGDATSYGHIVVESNGRTCYCGNKGCLTSYASYGAMLECIQQKKDSAIGVKVETVDQLINYLKQNDPIVKEVVSEAATYYGIGLANIVNVLHPDCVILHGKLLANHEEYYQEVLKSLERNIYNKNASYMEVRKGSLGDEAAAMGAAIQVFHTFFD